MIEVSQVMTRDVRLVDPGTTLKEAAAMMRDGDFGLLPIGENDRLVGTITDRDIAIRAVAAGKDRRARRSATRCPKASFIASRTSRSRRPRR